MAYKRQGEITKSWGCRTASDTWGNSTLACWFLHFSGIVIRCRHKGGCLDGWSLGSEGLPVFLGLGAYSKEGKGMIGGGGRL